MRLEAGSRKAWIRGLLSILLCFHLFAVAVAPNKESYAGMSLGRVMEPYLNFLGLASTWNFFAPDPGPPASYVEWELLDQSGQVISNGQIPEAPDPYLLRERQNRRIATARFLASAPQRTEQVLAPYLCRRYPETHSVRLWQAFRSIPNLFKVAEGERRIGDEKGVERKWIAHSFCAEGA